VLALGSKAAALAISALLTPAGGYQGPYKQGHAAAFRAGAAVQNFSPPARGSVPGGDPANCSSSSSFNGPRPFAFIEPYTDSNHNGHYDLGEPFADCNHNARWDGNLLGGGSNTPRYYDKVADPVGARALVVSARGKTIAVEVVDQEGFFNIYQQRIRAKVAADGYHLDGIFISATHDESAPDSLGLGGVSLTTSGVNDYWVNYMIGRSAQAIERAYKAMRPARIRYTEVLEPANVRQCWSSYPFVDDQRIPVLEAVTAARRPRVIATLASVSQHAETLGFNGGTPLLDAQNKWVSSDWISFFRASLERSLGGVGIEMAGSVGSVESPEVYGQSISRTPQLFVDASHPAGCRTLFKVGSGTDADGTMHVPLGYKGETRAFGVAMAAPIVRALRAGSYHVSVSNTLSGTRANICMRLENVLFELGAAAGVFAHRPGYNADCTKAMPVLPNGSSAGQALLSQVAAFRIGDGQFISVPGEVFPFTYLRGFLGPQDMPTSSPGLPPWLLPHMRARIRRTQIASAAVTPTTPSRRPPRRATSSAARSSGCSVPPSGSSRADTCSPAASSRAILSADRRSSATSTRRSMPADRRDPSSWRTGPWCARACGCRSAASPSVSPTATPVATSTRTADGYGWTCTQTQDRADLTLPENKDWDPARPLSILIRPRNKDARRSRCLSGFFRPDPARRSLTQCPRMYS
jgi:hypothetical protein